MFMPPKYCQMNPETTPALAYSTDESHCPMCCVNFVHADYCSTTIPPPTPPALHLSTIITSYDFVPFSTGVDGYSSIICRRHSAFSAVHEPASRTPSALSRQLPACFLNHDSTSERRGRTRAARQMSVCSYPHRVLMSGDHEGL